MPQMQRIAIIGSAGSGKSTLARKLADATGLPAVHLDAIWWLPGWKERGAPEFDRIVAEAVARDRWIIDGNYSRTISTRIERADTVIWLDYPRWRCLWRAVERRVMFHRKQRPDIGAGCPEKIDLAFLAWIWNYPTRSREKTRERLAQIGEGTAVIVFRHPREADSWLAGLVVRS